MLKTLPIESRLENIVKRLDETMDNIIDAIDGFEERLNKLEKKEPERTDDEIIKQSYMYLVHRYKKHPESGLRKCLTLEEFERLKNLMI